MHTKSKISKMYGALVLGGGMLVAPTDSTAKPFKDCVRKSENKSPKDTTADDTETTDAKKTKKTKKVKETKEQTESKEIEASSTGDVEGLPSDLEAGSRLVLSPPESHCQMEFTFYKYNSDGEAVEADKKCLDEKEDKAILKIIQESKEEACNTPFCGCWLG